MRVLIVDSHLLVAEAMAAVLRREDAGGAAWAAACLAEARRRLRAEAVDLLVLDASLCADPLRDLSDLQRIAEPAPIVLSTTGPLVWDPATLAACGLRGVVSKRLSGPAFAAALRLIACGERYFPAEHLRSAARTADALNDRERLVVAQLRLGGTNKVIAQRLGLDVAVVKSAVRSAGRKLGARTRTEIAVKSLQLLSASLARPAPAARQEHPGRGGHHAASGAAWEAAPRLRVAAGRRGG